MNSTVTQDFELLSHENGANIRELETLLVNSYDLLVKLEQILVRFVHLLVNSYDLLVKMEQILVRFVHLLVNSKQILVNSTVTQNF
ncbi:hypothetical protein J7E52_12055 [Bacillus sp. ISL-34]|uniref:hypothetical protein n=1 Tax=Bacillus sp. ISL-34 TaxID=2819121 RepID=UPI001BECC036|nr:hypothetical protein [Bacillus sp. ISL-34]MBT2647450.1 hypothetical protein [Bacillus sp. ISL-34]